MRLYELSAEIHNAIELYNHVETDEELKTIEEKLNALQTPFNEKCVAIAKHVLNIEADQTSVENEIKRLQVIAKRKEREAEWLRGYLFRHMLDTGNLEIDGTVFKLKIKKNPPSVVVEDESLVPDKYKRVIPEHKELDKDLIKQDHKAGIGVAGTRVEQKQRLDIR